MEKFRKISGSISESRDILLKFLKNISKILRITVNVVLFHKSVKVISKVTLKVFVKYLIRPWVILLCRSYRKLSLNFITLMWFYYFFPSVSHSSIVYWNWIQGLKYIYLFIIGVPSFCNVDFMNPKPTRALNRIIIQIKLALTRQWPYHCLTDRVIILK